MLLVGDAGVRLRPVADRFAAEADDQVSSELPGIAKKAAGFFAAAFAAVKIGGFLKDAVSDAVDIGENVSKVGVVFGSAAEQVNAFADTASSALGQSRNQALEAAGSFGTLFRGMGIGEGEAANLSTSLVTAASDMASFGNSTPQEALDALRSGLVGETEPLRRFGVMLNAAAIEQEAVRLGLMQTGGELSASAKAQATYSLIMQQTALQTGDFGRTSAGLANQQRILSAQFTDISTNIGGLFVPVLANAAGIVTGAVMPAVLRLTGGLPELGTALGSVGDMFRVGFSDGPQAVNDATASLEGLPFILGQVAGTAGDMGAIFSEVFADGKAGAEILASDGLDGLAARAGSAAFQIRDSLGHVWMGLTEGLAPVIGPLIGQVTAAFGTIGDTIGAAFGGGGGGGGLATFADLIGSLAQGALPLIIDYFTRWADVVAAVIPIIVTVLQSLVPVIAGIFQQVGPILQSLIPVISQVAGVFAGTLLTVITALTPVIPPLVAAIGQVASVLAGAFLTVLQTLAPVLPVLVAAIGQIAGVLAGAFASALGAIAPILPVIAGVIGQVAGMLAGALAGALQVLIPILPPIIDAFAQIALVLVGVLMGALQAILPIIPTLVGAFLALIQAAIVPLLPLLPILARLLLTIITALAPLIPPIIQLVALIIQLAVAAIMPLMPLIPIVIGLFTLLLNILMPVIQVVIGIVAAFIGMAATVASVVIGFVSTVIGIFTSFWSGVTGLVSRIVTGVTGGFQGLKDGVVGIFSGIASFVGGMFEGIGGAIKTAINGVIRGINNTVISGINVVIDGVNLVNPFDDIPHVPRIPTFHVGGIAQFGTAGQGLALLRNDETVVTPEDRDRAAALLVAAAGGRLGSAPAPGTTEQAGPITIEEHIHQAPGEPVGAVAARVTQSVVWNLNAGITRRIGAGATT